MGQIGTYIVIIVGVIVLLWILLYLIPIGLWFQALVSGVRISLATTNLYEMEESTAISYCWSYDRRR